MAEKETQIGRANMNQAPQKPISFKLKDKSVKNKHLDDEAVTTPKIKDKNVTPAKRSDDFDAQVVLPYVNPVDTKYQNITDELYSMIASLQVGGIALSQQFGQRTDIGISQKTLTDLFGRLFTILESVTHETYLDFIFSAQPTVIYTEESTYIVTATADCSEAVSDFDYIKFYLDNQLVAESRDTSMFTAPITVTTTSVIKAEAMIVGKVIVKEISILKEVPFFIGSGNVYADIMNETCRRELVGTLEGDYDVTVNNTGEKIFIIIPITRQDEFRRADMNGIDIPGADNFSVEIPFLTPVITEQYIVYESQNAYQAGTYNIDIDINS